MSVAARRGGSAGGRPRPARTTLLAAAAAAALSGCVDPSIVAPRQERDLGVTCTIPESQIFSGGVGKDGIPALTDPPLVGAFDPGADYLLATDRVIGVELGGRTIAVPHNILWWHEIVNLSVGDRRIAVTYCPLTGSSLAFDRSAIGGAELGVSGLLFRNNLVMYDRSSSESLWPQMLRGARCGPASGTELPLIPLVEMSWDGWRSLHPETEVVSAETGTRRDYRDYPYGDYERIDNAQTLFSMPTPLDRRRPPKERVLGLPSGEDGGLAFPFGALAEAGATTVAEITLDGARIVVLWSRSLEGGGAFVPVVDGDTLAFEIRDRQIVDSGTGSRWTVDGHATAGPLAGRRLPPVAEAYTAFWFAWASFQPATRIWRPGP